jgi:WD40 repeat protein/tetratricopeptide (TPR) repeat protein
VHRDLKPANILLTADGEPRITDFGLAKRVRDDDESQSPTLTESGQILGTAGYMSPEQASGRSRLVGPSSDIYSLGAVLYALLTSRAPFVGETPSHTIMQVLQNEPISPRKLNPSVPRDLENICLKCLEKEPHKRYGTAEELADDLNRFLVGRPVIARPIGRLDKTCRWARRNPWIAATAVLLMLIGLASPLFAVREADLRRTADNNAAFAADEAERANQEAATAKRLKQEAEDNLHLANKNAEAERLAKVATNEALSRVKYFLALAHWNSGRVADAITTLEEIPVVDRHLEWQIARGEFQGSTATLSSHVGDINAVVYSPDGKVIASGGSGEIRIWDAATGKHVRSIEVDGIVRCLRYSRDGTRLYSSSGNTIHVWDSTTAAAIGSLSTDSKRDEILSFDLHPLEPILVLGTHITNELGRLEWRNLSDGSQLRSVPMPHHGVRHVHFSPGGNQIATIGVFSGLAVWDSHTGELLWKRHRVGTDADFISDGSSLAIVQAFNGWSTHDLETGERLQQGASVDSQKLKTAECMKFHPSGDWLATAYSDGEIALINLNTNGYGLYRGHRNAVVDITFSPDGFTLASVSKDGTVKLWGLDEDKAFGREDKAFGLSERVYKEKSLIRTHLENAMMDLARVAVDGSWEAQVDIAIGKLGNTLAISGFSKDVEIRNTTDLRLTQTLTDHPDFVIRTAMSADETQVAAACIDKTICLWDLTSGSKSHTLHGHRDLVTDLEFGPDGHVLVSISLSGEVKVWNVREGRAIHTLHGHQSGVHTLAVSDDGETVVTAGSGDRLLVWDIQTGSLVREVRVGGKPSDIKFLPESALVCVAGVHHNGSGMIEIWNTQTGKRLKRFDAGTNRIISISLNSDASRLLTWDMGEVKLWDVENQQELLSYVHYNSAGRVLFCPGHPMFFTVQPIHGPDSGALSLPMSGAELRSIRGVELAKTGDVDILLPKISLPQQSRRQIDKLLRSALWSRDAYVSVSSLGLWLIHSDRSDTNFAIAVAMFHKALNRLREERLKASDGFANSELETLLPSHVQEALKEHPTAPEDFVVPKRPDPAFDSEIVRWYGIKERLEAASEHAKSKRFSEARVILQSLIDEAKQQTQDPRMVIAHVPYAISIATLYRQLADLETNAGRPEASRTALLELAGLFEPGMQKDDPQDWQLLADLSFDIDRSEEAADAYLKHMQLLGKTNLIPTDGEFCPYLRQADFHIVTRLMISRKFKPAAIDGKFIDDTPVYRARFEPWDGPYYYYWGIDEASFQRRSDEIQAEGLTMVDHRSFQNNDGKPLHCAIWEVARPSFKQGFIEGESLYVQSFDGGKAYAQDMVSFGKDKWSGGQHLLWMDAKPGNQLKLEFDINNAGDYKVETVFTTAPDFAIVDLKLNSVVVSKGIDLYRPNAVGTTGKLELGTHTLKAGRQQLVIEIKGANVSSTKKHGIGIDYLELTPTKVIQADVNKDSINVNTSPTSATDLIPHKPDVVAQESLPIETSSNLPKMLLSDACQTDFNEKVGLELRPVDIFIEVDPTTSKPLFGIAWEPTDGTEFRVRWGMLDNELDEREAEISRQGYKRTRVKSVSIGGVNHHIGLWTRPGISTQ